MQDEIVLTMVFVEQKRRTELADKKKLNLDGKETLEVIEAGMDLVDSVMQCVNANGGGGDGGGGGGGDGGGGGAAF